VKIGGNLQIDGAITITATAGEDLKAGDALYVAGAKTVKKADSTDVLRATIVGVAAKDTLEGEQVQIIIGGKAKGFKKLQAGKPYYLGINAGISTTVPVNAVKSVLVGVAFSDSELLIQIAPDSPSASSL
jgi:hypothetical protein